MSKEYLNWFGSFKNEDDVALMVYKYSQDKNKEKDSESIYSINKKMAKAIKDIAPWLAASLDGTECKEYAEACNAILELDLHYNTGNSDD